MNKATLRMCSGKNCWDNLILILWEDSSMVYLHHFRDRFTAFRLYRELYLAHSDSIKDNLKVEIDGHTKLMTADSWQAVLSCLDQWYGEYMYIVEGVGSPDVE